jgi:polyisoprenyl-phosphate glycosyltransferase
MEPRLLTILCPVHNEQAVIPLFFDRMRPILENLSGRYAVNLLFLNNASTDGTLQEIEQIRRVWPETYVLTTSKNVGYHASLECGLRNVEADLIIFIDVDCEDPPEMILQFVAKHEEGSDIVYGERVDREEPRILKGIRKLFYRLLRAVADEEIILDMAEFSLFTREVREAMVNENTSFPFIRASIGRVGFRRAAIPYKRQKRAGGRSHYNFFGMSVFAIGGILSASTLFLRLPILLLPFWIVLLTGFGIGYISTRSPWFVLAGVVTFGAYIGATAAFTALYVARTYKNGLHRPNAFIDYSLSILQPKLAQSHTGSQSDRVHTSGVVR